MRSFIIKGTICYSLSPKELAVHPNGYAVCVDGVSMGVVAHIPGNISIFRRWIMGIIW